MGMFNKDLKISDGQKYDLTQVSSEGVDLEEMSKKNKKLIDIFKAFDLNGDNKLNDLELAKAMDAFSKLDDGDGKLSKKELEAGAAMFNEMTNLNVKAKDLKAFIKQITKLTKNDTKVGTQQRLLQEANLEQMRKIAEDLKPDPVEIKKPEIEVKPLEVKPTSFDYTVQNGESYNNLIKRILAEKGIENPTKEDIAAAKAEFEKNNPGAVKKTSKGTEYLIVGSKVKLGVDLGDLDNASEQIGIYNKQAQKRREAAENAKYTVDAFYRNKDGSEGRHLKLKPTGEKAENGRYWAVDKQGNKYLVAHDGTILDAAKVAKKDAAIERNKKMASSREQYNKLATAFNEAKRSFDAQVKKDGWAANTADAIAGFFGSTNTEDHVRADLEAYKSKLNELKAALNSGDKAKFDAIYKELSQNDITNRVVKYNESQETGGNVVKGVTVGVVSGVAAVATGGASLAVTAAVAGGTTFVSSVAAETADLATNDIDGDVNAENMTKIVNKAGKEAIVSAATAGLLKGAGNMLSKTGTTAANTGKSVTPAVTNSADDAANATKGLLSSTTDDAANAAAKALPKTPTGGAAGGTSGSAAGSSGTTAGSAAGSTTANSADDAAVAASRTLPKPQAGSSTGASSTSSATGTSGSASAGSTGASTGRTASSTAGNTAANSADDAAAAAARAAKNARDLSLDDIADIERAIQSGKISNADMSKLVDITKMSRAELSKMSPAELSKALQSKGGLKELFTKYKASFTSDLPQGLNWAKQNPQAFKSIADKVNSRGISSLNSTELKQLADVLEMPVDALRKMSKVNYRKLSVKFHPDKNSGDETATQIFQMLSKIYAG
ncbi:MAG: DnaJ domain-containing protein [Clostridium sp.]|nr:DnaJ domain-containing protein [Clostridium sp.]